MKRGIRVLTTLACILAGGCSTPDLNPATPRPHTGYVDFYTDSDLELSWQVKRADLPSGESQTVFSEFEPLQSNILRLAAPPGTYRFEVWFQNQATEGPQAVEVPLADGKITPVHVTLTPSGSTFVQTKDYAFRGSAKGYGRGTKIRRQDNQVYRIGAVAADPLAYQQKERMPYFAPDAK